MKRVFLIVLDSVGVGAAPDAARFGDAGSNTLGTCRKTGKLKVPNLEKLGLFSLDGMESQKEERAAEGCFARMTEKSNGKDHDRTLGDCRADFREADAGLSAWFSG